MSDFSKGKISELLHIVEPKKTPEVPEVARITVHAAISRFSFLFERVRNVVDYKDEHLLRKAAIQRILRRQLMLEKDLHKVSENLVKELIAAKYLPNATLDEQLYSQVEHIIKRYALLKKQRLGRDSHYQWLLGIIAAELEELVSDATLDKRSVNFLYEQLANRVHVIGTELDETDRLLQIYIACHRTLYKADDEMLSFKLVRAYHASWMHMETWEQNPQDMALKMMGIEATVKYQLSHPLAYKIQQTVRPWAVSLLVLREALQEDLAKASGLLEKPDALWGVVSKIADRRMESAKSRLRRGTRRSMIYLFITKILIAIALEVPSELLFFREFHPISLAVNISFPPILMYFIGRLIHLPGKENTDRIKKLIAEMLSAEGPKPIEIRIPPARSLSSQLGYGIGYLAMFVCSFGLLFFLLHLAKFTWISSCVFLFFLSIVSFFGFRLRSLAREYVVVTPTPKFSTVVVDFFSIPILRSGQWLSEKVSKVNIFVFFFDFILETPLKLFLQVMEDWLAFMKEKKEELQ